MWFVRGFVGFVGWQSACTMYIYMKYIASQPSLCFWYAPAGGPESLQLLLQKGGARLLVDLCVCRGGRACRKIEGLVVEAFVGPSNGRMPFFACGIHACMHWLVGWLWICLCVTWKRVTCSLIARCSIASFSCVFFKG